MAGASDPLEDMLFSEVDEKAVSDLVGSLESQLVGQSNPAAPHPENRGGGSTTNANHHLGRTLPAQVGTPSEQQQQGQHKAEMNRESNSKENSSDKTVISSAASTVAPFEDPPTTSGTVRSASTSGLQSHGSSNITTLSASDGVTLPSPPISVNPANRSLATSSNETSAGATAMKKYSISTRRSAAAQSLNGNGGAVTSMKSPTTAAPVSTAANNANTMASNTIAASNTTVILSQSNVPTTTSSIPLDRGTPTIALHRLPSHIVASIAQNGNGTSVSALVQQGARIGPVSGAATQQVNHNTNTDALKSDLSVQAKNVIHAQPGTVNSVISTVSPAVNTVTNQQQSTLAVTLPAASSPVTLTAVSKPAVNVTGQPPTVTTVGMIQPAAVSSAPVVAASSQPQLRPGLAAPQRIVGPQLIVRPPQQQTTIQLPPGFTIPQGMVLVRTEMGQLVMVPQQALAQAQAQAQAQSNMSPRPATPTTGATFRVTTPQSPVTTQAIRPGPAVQAKAPAAVVAVTAPAPTPQPQQQQLPAAVLPPQAAGAQPAPASTTPTAATPVATPTPAPGVSVVSQEMQENVKKCKNFLATLIKLASHNSPSPETSRNVKALVQDLLDAKIEPEEFTNRLQTELKSSPQPYLVPFLKKSLPALRLALLNSQQSLTQPQGAAKPGVPQAVSPVPSAGTLVPAVRVRQPNSPLAAGAHSAALGIKRVGPGAQVRMPMVITQTVHAQGVVGKGPVNQAGKSPQGFAAQLPGNQKNKLNDPGGGSFRDDDDINDVASMAGVNLNEESARILATNSDLVGTQIRSCKDEAFLPTGLLHRRILDTAKRFGVTEVPLEAVNFIAHATQSRLRTVLEKVSAIAQHRMDNCKDDEWFEQSTDVRSQLKFFEQLERIEKQRKDEQEREILLKAAKSRSRQEDPEQARLKQKAKEMQQQELAQMRQRDANLTALAAIGPRKKRKMDSPGASSSGAEVSGSSAGSPAASSSASASSRQYARQRITRVNLRDFIFYMEQEREMTRSLLLYRALLK